MHSVLFVFPSTFNFHHLDLKLTSFSLLLRLGVSTAAALRTGPQLGVEGGEGGGEAALAGGVPYWGVEGGVVEDRQDGRHGGPGGGDVVQGDAGQGQAGPRHEFIISLHIPGLNIRGLNVLAFSWKEFRTFN